MDFSLVLVVLVAFTGLVSLIDIFVLAPKRLDATIQTHQPMREPLIVEYSRSFFPVILLVLLIRSFLMEPFRIPSGSLEPTLLTGDFVLVNKYDYGIRLPVLNKKIISIKEPKLADIVVFRWPVDPSIDYIKRIIGVPGDHIQYTDKVLYINGKKMNQSFVTYAGEQGASGEINRVEKRTEDLNGIVHDIYVNPAVPADNFDVVVPEGQYFAMGDNRDDSSDSRRWGFVPEENLIGKAVMVWMSWNATTYSVRWNRIGDRIV
ncbi:MAG: signal peptidase I [Proteobacteria bacterium]|nr:signal peptidase I [Pseudomonadota bacterium]